MSANVISVNGKPVIITPKGSNEPKTPLLLPDNTPRTSTGVIDTHYQDLTNQMKEDKKKILFIQTPIFMLFAELLGFASLLVEMAEEWCDPSKPLPPKSIQRLLEREARTIYDEMLEIFTEEEIHKLYDSFYTCGLDELEMDLIQKRKDNGDDLPF